MQVYVDKVKETMKLCDAVEIECIPREQNSMANALVRLATAATTKSFNPTPMQYLRQPSITEKEVVKVDKAEIENGQMNNINNYLQKKELLSDNLEVKKLIYKAVRYTLINGFLCRRGFSLPYLKYLKMKEGEYVFRKIHEGNCENHSHEKHYDKGTIVRM